MTCHQCQTWILDDDHRCPRCGRRVRSTPSRISPATYPIAATATAPAYDFEPVIDRAGPTVAPRPAPQPGQQALFSAPINESRVIPFDSLTSPAERDAIRLRVSEMARPTPEVSTQTRNKRAQVRRRESEDQAELAFQGSAEILRQPPSHVTCDAPVATAGVRVQAALFDAVLMACGLGIVLAMFFCAGGRFVFDKQLVPYLAASVLTVPLLYKLLWAFADRDTPGTRITGLELIDFDGRRPSRTRRFARLFGSVLSLLAAGIGMAWALVDEDKLTWHDHISGTFPTFSDE
jgi:uncharacterized RDD family membrane protein YckC